MIVTMGIIMKEVIWISHIKGLGLDWDLPIYSIYPYIPEKVAMENKKWADFFCPFSTRYVTG